MQLRVWANSAGWSVRVRIAADRNSDGCGVRARANVCASSVAACSRSSILTIERSGVSACGRAAGARVCGTRPTLASLPVYPLPFRVVVTAQLYPQKPVFRLSRFCGRGERDRRGVRHREKAKDLLLSPNGPSETAPNGYDPSTGEFFEGPSSRDNTISAVIFATAHRRHSLFLAIFAIPRYRRHYPRKRGTPSSFASGIRTIPRRHREDAAFCFANRVNSTVIGHLPVIGPIAKRKEH